MSYSHSESCGWWVHGECDCNPVAEIDRLKRHVKLLRDALEQMDLRVVGSGDLCTKEDLQDASRLEELRDAVLKETEQ